MDHSNFSTCSESYLHCQVSPLTTASLTSSFMYHTTLILLHRPLLVASVDARHICEDAAAQIDMLLERSHSIFGWRQVLFVQAYCVYTAATVNFMNIGHPKRSISESAYSRLRLELQVLESARKSCPGIARSIEVIETRLARMARSSESSLSSPTRDTAGRNQSISPQSNSSLRKSDPELVLSDPINVDSRRAAYPFQSFQPAPEQQPEGQYQHTYSALPFDIVPTFPEQTFRMESPWYAIQPSQQPVDSLPNEVLANYLHQTVAPLQDDPFT